MRIPKPSYIARQQNAIHRHLMYENNLQVTQLPSEGEGDDRLLPFFVRHYNGNPLTVDTVNTICAALDYGFVPERTETITPGEDYRVFFRPTDKSDGFL